MAGLGNVAKTGAQSAGRAAASRASAAGQRMAAPFRAGWNGQAADAGAAGGAGARSEEHTSELQSLMRISYAVFCLKKKKHKQTNTRTHIEKRRVRNNVARK